jgi:hypothetical protein
LGWVRNGNQDNGDDSTGGGKAAIKLFAIVKKVKTCNVENIPPACPTGSVDNQPDRSRVRQDMNKNTINKYNLVRSSVPVVNLALLQFEPSRSPSMQAKLIGGKENTGFTSFFHTGFLLTRISSKSEESMAL